MGGRSRSRSDAKTELTSTGSHRVTPGLTLNFLCRRERNDPRRGRRQRTARSARASIAAPTAASALTTLNPSRTSHSSPGTVSVLCRPRGSTPGARSLREARGQVFSRHLGRSKSTNRRIACQKWWVFRSNATNRRTCRSSIHLIRANGGRVDVKTEGVPERCAYVSCVTRDCPSPPAPLPEERVQDGVGRDEAGRGEGLASSPSLCGFSRTMSRQASFGETGPRV
jgi:hypothetical protein